jgi:protein crumbs
MGGLLVGAGGGTDVLVGGKVGMGVSVLVIVGVLLGVGVFVGRGVSVLVGVMLGVAVGGTGVGWAVSVGVGSGVRVAVAVLVAVGVDVGVGVGVGDGVNVLDGVGEGVELGLGVMVGVLGVGEGGSVEAISAVMVLLGSAVKGSAGVNVAMNCAPARSLEMISVDSSEALFWPDEFAAVRSVASRVGNATVSKYSLTGWMSSGGKFSDTTCRIVSLMGLLGRTASLTVVTITVVTVTPVIICRAILRQLAVLRGAVERMLAAVWARPVDAVDWLSARCNCEDARFWVPCNSLAAWLLV